MKIFYYCSTGVHTSAVAAALHLGLLPQDRFPSKTELGKLSFFGNLTKEQIGNPNYIGTDSLGNQVYTLGVTQNREIIKNSLEDLLKIYDMNSKAVLVDTTHINNFLIKWGLRFSGEFGLTLYYRGIKKHYHKLLYIVEQVA